MNADEMAPRPMRGDTRTLLITGGSGYLGRHLVRRATAEWQVVATYFSHPDLPAGCQTVPLDVRDGPAVARLAADLRPAAVIHTAYDMTSPEAMRPVIVEELATWRRLRRRWGRGW